MSNEQTTPPSDSPLPPPGWYVDPDDGQARRWWDGAAWTDHRDGPAPAAAAPEGSAQEGAAPGATATKVAWADLSAEQKAKNIRTLGCGGLIVAGLILLVGSWLWGTVFPSADKANGDKVSFYVACQGWVEAQLKSPSTADFPPTSSAMISNAGPNWQMTAYVDAANSFGASVRTPFSCRATYNGNDSWTGSATLNAR